VSIELTETGTTDVYYKCSYDNGVTWTDIIQFTTDENEDVWPLVTQTSDMKMWVVWTSNRDGEWDVYLRTSLVGDVNEDGVVDVRDLAIVAKAYGTFKGDSDYNPDADINKDGVVDMRDIAIVAKFFGET
jgi:hypothetical protein